MTRTEFILSWILLLNTIALAWCMFKVYSLAKRIDRLAQYSEHPDYYERKSIWCVLWEVL